MRPPRSPWPDAGRWLLLVLCLCACTPLQAGDDARALRSQALALEHGEGIPRDPQRALQLYCEAARLGDAEAQYSAGWMHANARGTPRDDALAAYFFALAAAQGHIPAERMLRFVGEPADTMPECMRPPPLPEPEDEIDLPAGEQVQKIAGLVRALAPEYGISPRLVLAVIRSESNFNPQAVSPKNAQGLMQLIPDTAIRFNVRKPFDPEQNLRGGLAYLRWLLAYFEGDVALVAAAYNAGEGAVNRFRGVPPFPETREYVRRITDLFRNKSHPYDPGVTSPSPELPRMRSVRAS
ncbi:MAG: transglycosylase SLT domain-containing protein [Proteobacteria bacterium]|nr:transglycosylase SLT domain-containing protein [Pseudomonadota bacterium]